MNRIVFSLVLIFGFTGNQAAGVADGLAVGQQQPG